MMSGYETGVRCQIADSTKKKQGDEWIRDRRGVDEMMARMRKV